MSDNDTDSSQLDGLAADEAANDKAKGKSKPAKAKAKPAVEKPDNPAKAEVFANSGFNRRRVWPD